MPTECSADLFGFARVEGRLVVAGFDGGMMTSDAGGLLPGATNRAIGLIDRFAQCFTDSRSAELIEHTVATMIGQRVFGIALGYEDVVDHDELRYDPIMAVLADKLTAKRKNCAPVAGKSTLNRLELGREESTLYHKISHDPLAIEAAFVDLFIDAHTRPPRQIILDLDAADLPLHGGHVPKWLAGRMTRLGTTISEAIVHHYGRLRRFAHPFWFQSFGAVSGLAPLGGELGIHVCGGRRPLPVSNREARADGQGGQLIAALRPARQSASSSSSRRSDMRGCHSAGAGRITTPGSSWPQSTRIVQRKRLPTSKVDSMTVLRGRRGGTGSK
jgi:Transposase DDE domain group 1/Protein of unknown function (DUF763)